MNKKFVYQVGNNKKSYNNGVPQRAENEKRLRNVV